MAEVFFDCPPILNGDEETQLRQLQRYLNTMSDKLNTALMTISIEQMAPETQKAIRSASGENVEKNMAGLKSMIIKTADIVRQEMDQIRITLESRYEAISEQFGTYEENLTQNITETAEGILQEFQFESRIQGLETSAGETQDYISKADSFIFMGVLGLDDNNEPITGIAIGDGVTKYVDGVPTLNDEKKLATFTKDKLSFYLNETEVAYFSNNTFFIDAGEIVSSLKMGNHTWKRLSGGALALVAG